MIVAWYTSFGSAPVYPRFVLDHAIDTNDHLLVGILEVCGIDPVHPHPEELSAWLSKNENRYLTTSDGSYRFSKFGHRWRLLPIPRPKEVAV